jgi:AcrR family transcriptional regulator
MSSATDQTVASRPSESSTAARPMRKDAARNRELLLASARVVFAQRGADASLDDIARHAGLGVGTAYRHFGNKYELLDALMVQLVDQFILTAENSLDVEDPWQGIVVFLERALEAQVNNRGLREVMLGFHESAKFDEVNDRVNAVLGKLLERARRSGDREHALRRVRPHQRARSAALASLPGTLPGRAEAGRCPTAAASPGRSPVPYCDAPAKAVDFT